MDANPKERGAGSGVPLRTSVRCEKRPNLPRHHRHSKQHLLDLVKLLPQSLAKTLLPAYRVQNVEFRRLERFKTELARLLEFDPVFLTD